MYHSVALIRVRLRLGETAERLLLFCAFSLLCLPFHVRGAEPRIPFIWSHSTDVYVRSEHHERRLPSNPAISG